MLGFSRHASCRFKDIVGPYWRPNTTPLKSHTFETRYADPASGERHLPQANYPQAGPPQTHPRQPSPGSKLNTGSDFRGFRGSGGSGGSGGSDGLDIRKLYGEISEKVWRGGIPPQDFCREIFPADRSDQADQSLKPYGPPEKHPRHQTAHTPPPPLRVANPSPTQRHT
jgi:hypothetical protein